MDIRTITLIDDTRTPAVIKKIEQGPQGTGTPGAKGDKGDPGSGTVDDRIYAYGQLTSAGLTGVTVSVGALALGDYRVFPSWAGNPKEMK